jgi:hypothetical protein
MVTVPGLIQIQAPSVSAGIKDMDYELAILLLKDCLWNKLKR